MNNYASTKLNRLLEITTLLLNRGTVTAAELADRFHVSIRTIYRDVDTLSLSGIPVYATRGIGGGISLLENYSLNKTLLSETESQSILLALQTLKSTQYPEIDQILEKMGALFHNAATDWVQIDYSPWGSSPNSYDKFTHMKTAILSGKYMEMDYISASGIRSHRRIAPLRLLFKSQAWYLWGWCCERKDYRLFRISRIRNLVVTSQLYNRSLLNQSFSSDEPPPDSHPRPMVHLVLQFAPEALSRLYDDYDDGLLQVNSDGTVTLSIDFPEDEWVYGYLLSFGPYVKILSPTRIQQIIREKSKTVASFYE